MTIRTRLIVSTAALLCLASGIIGTVAINAVTGTMTDRLDAQLREYLRQPPVAAYATTRAVAAEDADAVVAPARPLAKEDVPYQAVAMIFVAEDGTAEVAYPAGYFTNPLPPPVLPADLPAEGSYAYARSADGSTRYRILAGGPVATVARDGAEARTYRLVLAAPTTEVDAVQHRLIWTMLVTIALVLLLSVLGSWAITRRGLRPVDDMVDTAAAIAAGDLDRRVAEPKEKGELARLAGALNTMVSRLVHAHGERQSQQERLRRFVADASHELRTPLATISGYAELYESGGTPEGPMLDRAMSRIRAESGRMGGLVDDMLVLARLDDEATGTAAAARTARCDLAALARDAVDDARATDEERAYTAVLPETLAVRANEAELRQVLSNLLANARMHTPPGTSVRVSLTEDAEGVLLTVADDGPGMPEKHRARVFDRFYRADPSRSRATGGSGLGLSIVDGLVAAHGGAVAVESTPGAGTAVHVRLPRRSPDSP